MKVALDAMGGDFAPVESVKGAILALKEINDLEIILVGKKEEIENELKKYSYPKERIDIFNAKEVIEMGDDPIIAVKNKKDSSMIKSIELVRDGVATAVVSAGNTGALISASQLKLKRIKGVLRPAITTVFPAKDKEIVILDVGATADCRAEFLNQFATMGSFYYEKKYGIKIAKVGLLNIGTEVGKGNELTRETYNLLKENKNIEFVGNVESREMMEGKVEVLVTDGFTGNMILKTSEGIANYIFKTLKKEIENNFIGKIGAYLMKPIFNKLKKKIDSSEYGGALFLGVNGISIKAHGNSKAKGIKNALKMADKFAKDRFVEKLSDLIEIK